MTTRGTHSDTKIALAHSIKRRVVAAKRKSTLIAQSEVISIRCHLVLSMFVTYPICPIAPSHNVALMRS